MKKYFILPVLFLFAMTSMLFAEQSAQSMGFFDLEFYFTILKGAFIGFMTVFAGWAKKQEPGKWNWRGLVIRVPTGVVIGVIAAYNGMTFSQAEEWAAGIGLIMCIDYSVKAFLRRVKWFKEKEKLQKVINLDKDE